VAGVVFLQSSGGVSAKAGGVHIVVTLKIACTPTDHGIE